MFFDFRFPVAWYPYFELDKKVKGNGCLCKRERHGLAVGLGCLLALLTTMAMRRPLPIGGAFLVEGEFRQTESP